MDAGPSFAEVCAQAAPVLAGFGGYFIERISHDTVAGGSLEIHLHERPLKPEAILVLGGLRHLSMGDTSDLDGCFADEIELTYIPRSQSYWPDGLTGLGPRHRGLPDLAWLHLVGPTPVDAVATRVQIYLSLVPPG